MPSQSPTMKTMSSVATPGEIEADHLESGQLPSAVKDLSDEQFQLLKELAGQATSDDTKQMTLLNRLVGQGLASVSITAGWNKKTFEVEFQLSPTGKAMFKLLKAVES